MATYYISPNGSDANNGLGPDASAVTNKPWLTLGKAMNTGATVVPGDTVNIAPGYYYSNALIPIAAIASTGSPTTFAGDPTNKLGFKTAGGVLLAPGVCWVTTRTAAETNDGDPASTADLITLATNKPSGLTFSNLALEASLKGTQAVFNTDFAVTSNIVVQDCRLIGQRIVTFSGTAAPTAARNLTFRRCIAFTKGWYAASVTTAAATANANLALLVEECFVVGKFSDGAIALGASGGNIAGGISFFNCTLLLVSDGNPGFQTTALRVSTTNPCNVGGCLIVAAVDAFSAGTLGQIIDAGNNRVIELNSNSSWSNVTLAGTTKFRPLAQLALPDLVKWGLELPRADMFGWTDAADTAQRFSAAARTTPDFFGRTARPWGAGSSMGCFQAVNVVQDATSAISSGGVNSLKLTGAGEVSFFVPVDATATTISVVTKSTSYGGTNWPQLIVVANGAVGLAADQTVTATSATEATITSPSFTPTVKGVVEVRLVSRSSSTTSVTYFDVLASP